MTNKDERRKANNERKLKFKKETYDIITIYTRKGRKRLLTDYAAQQGESVNSLVNRLVAAELQIPLDEWNNEK